MTILLKQYGTLLEIAVFWKCGNWLKLFFSCDSHIKLFTVGSLLFFFS